MRVTAITCVKNEGPFLLEWIAYNRLIGVTDFLIYTNDCTDGTDALLDALAAHGLVTRLDNPAEGRNYQMEALKDARRQEAAARADWLWIADVDEFLDITTGAGTLPDLIAACGDPQAISIPFQFFANGGIDTFEDRPVIEQFTRTHNPDIWCDETAIEVKTLVRRDFPVKYLGAHRPFMKEGLAPDARPRWTDAGGQDVPWKFRTAANKRRIRKFPVQGARGFATLNHYALRSLDSYLVKNDRGDVNRAGRAFDDTYWRERNDDIHEDSSIQRRLPELRAEIARLKALDGIAALHEAACAAHAARAADLRADADYAALADTLRAAPTISPQELAFIRMLETA